MTTVYVSIGNSDDKLTQAEWAEFVADVDRLMTGMPHADAQVHGRWLSEPSSQWQNACWCVELRTPEALSLARAALRMAVRDYRQDSIAVAYVHRTEFLTVAGGA